VWRKQWLVIVVHAVLWPRGESDALRLVFACTHTKSVGSPECCLTRHHIARCSTEHDHLSPHDILLCVLLKKQHQVLDVPEISSHPPPHHRRREAIIKLAHSHDLNPSAPDLWCAHPFNAHSREGMLRRPLSAHHTPGHQRLLQSTVTVVLIDVLAVHAEAEPS
jgi:hypothetical protein